MRRAPILLAVLVLAGCSTKYIKFPAEEYLIGYWKERLALQDDTFQARKKCAVVKAVILAPGTGVPVPVLVPANYDKLREKCEQLEARLATLEKRDLATIQASLDGDTIDPEMLEQIRGVLGPLLELAKLIPVL